MQRRLQFGMRENPASDRRHGSRSVVQKDLSATTSTRLSRQQEMPTPTKSFEVASKVAEGFATRDRKDEAVDSAMIASSIKGLAMIQRRAGGDRRPQHAGDDTAFEPLLDVAEAAKLLRIHPKTLRVKAGRGIIPGIQIGRVWRFRASMLNRWLEGIAGHGLR